MQLLPPELKCLITELSSHNTGSLAALARTHTAYKREAERALYDTLLINVDADNSLKCMGTLARNQEKAALVRFLIIEYPRNYNKLKHQRLTTYLSKSLINMQSLSDYRIISWPLDEPEMASMGKILWSVCKILIFS